MLKDNTHPGQSLFTLQSPGKRYSSSRRCTTGLQSSVFTQAVWLLNSSTLSQKWFSSTQHRGSTAHILRTLENFLKWELQENRQRRPLEGHLQHLQPQYYPQTISSVCFLTAAAIRKHYNRKLDLWGWNKIFKCLAIWGKQEKGKTWTHLDSLCFSWRDKWSDKRH